MTSFSFFHLQVQIGFYHLRIMAPLVVHNSNRNKETESYCVYNTQFSSSIFGIHFVDMEENKVFLNKYFL